MRLIICYRHVMSLHHHNFSRIYAELIIHIYTVFKCKNDICNAFQSFYTTKNFHIVCTLCPNVFVTIL